MPPAATVHIPSWSDGALHAPRSDGVASPLKRRHIMVPGGTAHHAPENNGAPRPLERRHYTPP